MITMLSFFFFPKMSRYYIWHYLVLLFFRGNTNPVSLLYKQLSCGATHKHKYAEKKTYIIERPLLNICQYQ